MCGICGELRDANVGYAFYKARRGRIAGKFGAGSKTRMPTPITAGKLCGISSGGGGVGCAAPQFGLDFTKFDVGMFRGNIGEMRGRFENQ